MRFSLLFALLSALTGVVLGGIAWWKPESGVDGTPGALLALAGAVFVAIGVLLALTWQLSASLGPVLNALTGLGAALTAIAAWFLMQYAFAAAMVLALFGFAVALGLSRQRRAP